MKVVGGIDVEGQLPVWDDPNGVERVLQAALGRKDDTLYVMAIAMMPDGSLKCFSNCNNSVIVLGMLNRSTHIVNTNIDNNGVE